MSTRSFVDYFGAQVGAANYAQARPSYPPAFLDSIVAMCSGTPNLAFLQIFYIMRPCLKVSQDL
jgi:hypothetical protein